LLPGIEQRYLPVAEAIEALGRDPGLVPIAIDPGGDGRLYFADIGEAPFLEWKYIYTIERLARENAIARSFATERDLLRHELPTHDALLPHGLIFHASRCGSTLLCKALARLPENLIVNQGGPLQYGFWSHITDGLRTAPEPSAENLRMFRNLVLLMTRRRREAYGRSFVKFISWNVVFATFIRAALPEPRALYLYRDPAEIIAIVLQETTAALRARGTPWGTMLTGLDPAITAGMGDAEFLARCYARYFETVAGAAENLNFRLAGFEQVSRRASLPRVLGEGLGWVPDTPSLERMRAQYAFDSKDDSNRTRYRGEPENLRARLRAEDLAQIDDLTRARLDALDRSPRNLTTHTKTK